MLKRTIISTAALAGFVFLAFGSSGGSTSSDFDFDDFENLDAGGSFDNVGACKSYVTKVNGLACMSAAKMNPDDICPDALNLSPLDMSGYYSCMADNSKCDGNIPDLSGISNCEMPTP